LTIRPVLAARTATLRTSAGKPRAKFRWKKHEPFMPSGHRSATSGRSAVQGRMRDAMR
jgi:hypothetical protein